MWSDFWKGFAEIDWADVLIRIGIGLFFLITLVRCALKD